MNMSVDQLIQSGVDQAKRVLIGKPGAALGASFVIQFKNRPPAMIAAPWSNDDEKRADIEGIRMVLKLYSSSVTSYLFWSEAWQASEDPKHPTRLMPRDREDRKEVVIINAYDHKGGKMRALEIVRGPDGVVTDLVENDMEDGLCLLGGRLHNLLKDEE